MVRYAPSLNKTLSTVWTVERVLFKLEILYTLILV